MGTTGDFIKWIQMIKFKSVWCDLERVFASTKHIDAAHIDTPLRCAALALVFAGVTTCTRWSHLHNTRSVMLALEFVVRKQWRTHINMCRYGTCRLASAHMPTHTSRHKLYRCWHSMTFAWMGVCVCACLNGGISRFAQRCTPVHCGIVWWA